MDSRALFDLVKILVVLIVIGAIVWIIFSKPKVPQDQLDEMTERADVFRAGESEGEAHATQHLTTSSSVPTRELLEAWMEQAAPDGIAAATLEHWKKGFEWGFKNRFKAGIKKAF